MTYTNFLEIFDAPAVEEAAAPAGPTQDYFDGHADGMAEALAAASEIQAGLSSELVQTLADMSFGYNEAKAHILQGLRPLFRAVLDALLPEIARTALVPHLVELLTEAAIADAGMPLTIVAHPSNIDAVAAALEQVPTLPVDLRGDATFGPGQAMVCSDHRETMLDLDDLRVRISTVLEAIFDDLHEGTAHG